MFDSDKWQEIFNSLGKNKLRTTLTAFGVFWGIFMLIIMLGSGNGLQNGVTKNFGGTATNSVFIWTQRTSVPFAGLPKGRRFNMRNEDIEVIRAEVPELDKLAPRNQLRGYQGGNNVSYGTKSGAFSVMGDYPDVSAITPMEILSGRFLNQFDIKDKRKVVVIGTNVRDVLFGETDPIEKYVKINGVYFKVVGVWKTKKSGNQGERDTQTLYIPFTTFQKAFNYGNIVGWIAATAKPEASAVALEEKVIRILKERHKIAPEDDRAFGSFNAQEAFERMNGLFGGISMLIWVVGTGTLIAGVIGVSNIMLIIVKERTKEIGVRRAIGASPWNIISQIMLESIFLTSLAGYFGLLLGVFVTEMAAQAMGSNPSDDSMFTNPTIDLEIAITALIVLIVSGAFAGLIPARKAVKIKPIEALRTE